MTQTGPDASGLVTLHLTGDLTAGAAGSVDVELRGTSRTGDGVTISSGTVTVSDGHATYQGDLVQLVGGQQIVASMPGPGGSNWQVVVVLTQLDLRSGTMSADVQATRRRRRWRVARWRRPVSRRRARPPRAATIAPGAPVGLPRLLAPPVADHPAHLARYGPLPGGSRRAERGDLIAAVERSGLRGRGGAGFPTGRKLRAVANGGRGPVVVANGAEGEPASNKDSVLMQRAPHLVIDGAAAAAHAVGADAIHFVVDRADVGARDAMTRAILERAHEMPRPGSWRVVELPSRYVAGEESAVVNFLNGREAKPVSVPPRPYERGVRGRPTLVQNVETLANLGLIARYGPAWFASVGTTDEPGSLLATVSGAVVRPGIYEFAFGTRFDTVLDAAGGVSEPVQALLVGGYFGAWLRPEQSAGLALAHGVLRHAGAALGCGVVSVLPVAACGVTETALGWPATWPRRAQDSVARAFTGSLRSPTRSRRSPWAPRRAAPCTRSSAGSTTSPGAGRATSPMPRSASSGRRWSRSPTTSPPTSAAGPVSTRVAPRCCRCPLPR